MGEVFVSRVVTSCRSLLFWPAFWVFCSSPPALWWKPPGQNWSFLEEARKGSAAYVSGWLCVWGGVVHGFWAIVLRRLWACCFFLHAPLRHRCFGRLMSLKSDHEQVGCYCIWKPSTSGSWTLTSKIKRIPPFRQLSCYLPMCMDVGCLELGPEKMTLCWVDS